MPEAPTIPTPEPADASVADICVLLNPGSGKRQGGEAEAEIGRLLADHPGRAEVRRVRSGGEIGAMVDEALAEGFEVIVAAGGDGTVAAVASRLAGSGRLLGVLPLGTFNFFARTLGLPEDIAGAVEVIRSGRSQPALLGEINGEGFLNNASLGAYAAILHRRESVYRRWGRSRLAAYWSVIKTLAGFRHPTTFRVTVDGVERRARSPLLFVACNAHQLEAFDLPGGDYIRDGKFAVFIAPDCGRWELIRFAIRLAFRASEEGRDFELMGGQEVVVETRQRRRLIARDGERERMTGPFRFVLRSDALRVLVPAETG